MYGEPNRLAVGRLLCEVMTKERAVTTLNA